MSTIVGEPQSSPHLRPVLWGLTTAKPNSVTLGHLPSCEPWTVSNQAARPDTQGRAAAPPVSDEDR